MIEPRHKTSKKGTDFPADYIKMIRDVITKTFKRHMQGRTVIVQGNIYPDEVVIRIGFKMLQAVAQKNFEASVDFSVKEKNILDRINLCMDALGSMIDQYFKEDGEIDMPRSWTEFKLDGKSVYLKVSGENPELEDAADAFLKKAGFSKKGEVKTGDDEE